MADNLQDIGIRAVAENISQYVSALNTFNQKTDESAKKTQEAAKATTSLDKASASATGSVKGATQAATQAGGAMEEMGGMAEVASGAIAGVTIAVGIVVAAVGAFIALAQRGAGFVELENGFNSITAAVNVNANALLKQLHDATGGTISDMELLTEVNRTLIGVTGDFGRAFGEALPGLMKTAKAVAEATGRDVTQVFDSITESIKRGNTRGLQSIGIIIDQKKAFDDYAKSIGVSSTALTKAQQEQALLNAVNEKGAEIQKAMGEGVESNADKQEKAGVTITNFLDKLSSSVQPIFSMILDGINGVLDALSAILSPFITYIGAIVSFAADGLKALLQPVFEFVGRIVKVPGTFENVAKNFFQGGARMIGSLAKGILAAANQYVFPAVLSIAKGIADFLVGLSPPPKGPLSLIDQGGANTMQAWISGFTGVSLDPVENVAAQVNSAMGDIAGAGIETVKTRLAQLDQALAPFQQRLQLVSAQFDALKPAQEAAFRSIDRQLSAAQKALEGGDTAAAALVQHLDEQKAQLQGYVDAQQESIDNAQIQLAFAQAQQAQERAILDIRQKQIGPQTTPKKEPKGAGGGGAAETPETGGAGFAAGGGFSGIVGDVGAAKEDIKQGLQEGLADAMPELQTTIGLTSQIGAEVKRIGSVDLGKSLKEKFDSLFNPDKEGSITSNINKWIEDTFGADAPNGIVAWIKKLPDGISTALSGIGTAIMGVLNPVADSIAAWVDGIVNVEKEGSVPYFFDQLVNVFVPQVFKTVGEVWDKAIVQPIAQIWTNIRTNIDDLFNSDKPMVGIKWFIQTAVDYFSGFPGQIEKAMIDLGTKLTAAIITPVAAAGDTLLTAIHDVIAGLIDGIKKFVISIAQGFPGTGNLIAGINAITVPPFGKLSVPGAAEGGVFGKGMFSANPREEIFGAADKMAVFPQEFITSIRGLTAVMTQMTPAMQQATSYSNTNINRSMNNTFNGIQDSGEAVRRLATMAAFT